MLAAPDMDMEVPDGESTPEDLDPMPLGATDSSLPEGQPFAAGALTGDPFSFLQWPHLPQVMDITSAHERGITGQGVTIAVVDSGVDCSHPDLRPPVASISFVPLSPRSCTQDPDCPMLPDREQRPSQSTCDPERRICVLADGSTGFEDPCDATNTHGTSVAGIIAAVCGNGIGVCGVAPDARIVNVKDSPADGSGFPLSRALEAFDWASTVGKSRYGVRIINFSAGATCHDADPSCRDGVVHLYKIANRMLSVVYKRGVVIFAAAGNDGMDVSQDKSYKAWPAKDSPHTITVGATGPCNAAGDGNVQNDFYDNLAVYSNYGFPQGENRYLVMPGGQRLAGCTYPTPTCRVGTVVRPCQAFDMVLTLTKATLGLLPLRGYTVFSGTSAGVPHASALAALMLSRHPELGIGTDYDLTPGQLTEAMLMDLTVDIGAPGYDPLFGYGRGSAGLIP